MLISLVSPSLSPWLQHPRCWRETVLLLLGAAEEGVQLSDACLEGP